MSARLSLRSTHGHVKVDRQFLAGLPAQYHQQYGVRYNLLHTVRGRFGSVRQVDIVKEYKRILRCNFSLKLQVKVPCSWRRGLHGDRGFRSSSSTAMMQRFYNSDSTVRAHEVS